MEANIKITREQVFFLSFLAVFGNVVYTHTWIDDFSDRSAWLAAVLGILFIIPFAMWILKIGTAVPECTIFDILEKGMGKITCIIICVIYILINITIATTMVNMFAQMIKVFFLHMTPSWVVILCIILVSMAIAGSKIKIMGRLVELMAVICIFNYFSAFIVSVPNDFNIDYIVPIFDVTWRGFLKSVLFILGNAAETLLFLMIMVKFIPLAEKRYRWVAKGIVFSSFIFPFAIFLIMAIMSPELSKRIAFGGVNAAKIIKIGDFISGLEIFIFGTYQFLAIAKTFLCIYCIWTTLCKMFNKISPKFNIVIASIFILMPSVWLDSYNKAYFLAVLLARYIILPFSVLTLLLASLSVKIIKNKEKRLKN